MRTGLIRINRVASDERARRSVMEAVRAAPNGELADVERVLSTFEQRYGISSSEVRGRVERGELRATRDVEAWLMAIHVRDDLAALKTR